MSLFQKFTSPPATVATVATLPQTDAYAVAGVAGVAAHDTFSRQSDPTKDYYTALAEFEAFEWLDGQPEEVIEEHYPKLQAALDRVRQLYAEMIRQGIKVSVTTKEVGG